MRERRERWGRQRRRRVALRARRTWLPEGAALLALPLLLACRSLFRRRGVRQPGLGGKHLQSVHQVTDLLQQREVARLRRVGENDLARELGFEAREGRIHVAKLVGVFVGELQALRQGTPKGRNGIGIALRESLGDGKSDE